MRDEIDLTTEKAPKGKALSRAEANAIDKDNTSANHSTGEGGIADGRNTA